MAEWGPDAGYGFHEVDGCLIVSVAPDLDEDGLGVLRTRVVNHLATSRVSGVVINVSALLMLSSLGFSILKQTAGAVGIMGARAVFAGFQPGVAATLVELGTDLGSIRTAVTVADALGLIRGAGLWPGNDLASYPDWGSGADPADDPEGGAQNGLNR